MLEQDRFSHVLVDEYQDTNLSQYRILQHLCKKHNNLCVVGDDDQSIYGWRGAEVRHILGFHKDFPNAKVVRLEENYRSCPNIIKLANQLIRRNVERHDKTLRAVRPANDHPRFAKYEDEQTEAEGVVRDLCGTAAKENLPWRSFAILFRTNEQPRLFETELRARNVPYVLVGGYSFFDRREVRDVMAYLKVVANPADEVGLLRIINTPARGIGASIVEKLLQRATSAGVPLWNILPEAVAQGLLPSKSNGALGWFVELIQTFQDRLSRPPLVGNVRDLIDKIGYRAEIARNYESPQDQESRWAAIGEILNMVEHYERRVSAPTLSGFLEEITLDNKDDQKDDDHQNRVTLMTLHSAKGLEFPHVYLVGMEERLLPHERSLDSEATIAEERRLAYVGITRARDRLTITRAQFRSRFGQRLPTQASRFLPEMYGVSASGEASLEGGPPGNRGSHGNPGDTASPKSSPPRGFRNGRYSRKP
ncbi:MAG: 3'-5' exonuclease [Planctomycetota bacterium]